MTTVVIGLYKTRCECGAEPKDGECPACGAFTDARRDFSGGSWLPSDEESYRDMARRNFGIKGPL